MQLPQRKDGQGVEIGISDILAWRDCAMRAKMGRRRLEGKESPEMQSPAAAYGSAIHLCLEMLDDGATPGEAAGAAMEQFKKWLEPSDLSRLHEDMERYLDREMIGVRTLLNEGEIAVRLFEHPVVGQVWFRGRIDRLYQSLDNAALLTHIDFKSSKWAKSEEEIHGDLQLWAYNWLIVEWFTGLYPEVDDAQLTQLYDQLRYGMIPTTKGDAQREEIKRWLIAAITAMVNDEEELPSWNQWCAWCSLKMDCPVVQHELTDWALTRIAALMPREEKRNKDGSISKRPGKVQLDPKRLQEYVDLLADIKRAAQVLSAFDEEVRATLKEMPDSELHYLGKKKSERSRRAFSVEAKRRIIDEIGLARFLMIADLSIASIERFFQGDKERVDALKGLAEKRPGYTIIEDL